MYSRAHSESNVQQVFSHVMFVSINLPASALKSTVVLMCCVEPNLDAKACFVRAARFQEVPEAAICQVNTKNSEAF